MNRPSSYYQVTTRWNTGGENVWVCWLGKEAALQTRANNLAHPHCVSCRVHFVEQPPCGARRKAKVTELK
jgi:hypothetical protein